jgi:hypothetical protein
MNEKWKAFAKALQGDGYGYGYGNGYGTINKNTRRARA